MIKLLTTNLYQSRSNPDIYYEKDIKTQRLLRIARCIDRYIDNGRYIRDCAPVLNLLNNETAEILELKRL